MRNSTLIMGTEFFKRYLPHSLFGRAVLILIVPLIVLQLVVAIVFVQRHFEGVTRQMTRNIAREIAVAQQVIETSPSAEIAQLRLINLSKPLALTLELDADAPLPGAHQRDWFDLSGKALTGEMEALLGTDISVNLIRNIRMVDVEMLTEKGVLHAIIPRSRVTASNPHQLLVLMTASAAVLAIISFMFLRNQMRPILQLADASEAFGKGRSTPFRPAGAEEVRRAGTAFLSMRSRLERQIEQRTLMLSGVSHDLRTPLTRMKLALALVEEDSDIADMQRDVSDMERMLDEFLAFAKGDQLEDMVSVDPIAMVKDIANQMKRSGRAQKFETEIDGKHNGDMMMRESAVRRAIQNLLNNAAHYGKSVRLGLRLLPKTFEIWVEDDGPGIPPESYELVLRPFARLDASRNLNDGGGVGLGLSIAQDVAQSHGGALELSKSDDMGGLKATFRLPR